ncbi:MAG: diguanylate cyclase [Actinomycetia bacterium]|nr:diguanylate cyclase [Actinomycetes bacterium]
MEQDLTGDASHASVTGERSAAVAPLVALWVLLVATYVITSLVEARSTASEVVRQLAYIAPFAGSLFVVSAQLARSSGEERRFWRSLAFGIALITVSETYVSSRMVMGLDLAGGWPALPTVLSSFAGVGFSILLLRLADFRMLSRAAIMRHIIDMAGVVLVVFGLALATVLVPLSQRYAMASAADMLLAAGYSALGALILLAVTVDFASSSWRRWQTWERQIVAGIGVYGLATFAWPAWYFGTVLDPASHADVAVELLWMSGMALAFAASVTRMRSPKSASRFSTVPRIRLMGRNALAVAVPVVFTAAVPLFAYLGRSSAASPPIAVAYTAAAIGLAVVVAARQVVVAVENEWLFKTAANDPVTDLLGHRYFHERLQVDIDLAMRHGNTVSVAVVDLDDFTRVNDVWGHGRGDEVLRQAARVIKSACRASDVVCRLGGDEFAVVLPGGGSDDASALCARIKMHLAEVECPDGRPLTASMGVAVFPYDATDRAELIRKAEGAVYWAKYHGKDRVVVFDESVVEALSAEERIARLETETDLSTVRALAAAVDARDPLTQFHSRNVSTLVGMLARDLGLDDDRVRLLEMAALLHDIGKIGVSDRILHKRAPLSAAELKHVREHPVLGERILSSANLEEILPWVRHHHERYDGTGYPEGLAGEEIPFESRLLAICDAYDAMTSGRPYRSALSPGAAIQELDLCMGTQFDPVLTEAFIRLVGRRRLLRADARFERAETEGLVGAD